jgi:hypothetical protein
MLYIKLAAGNEGHLCAATLTANDFPRILQRHLKRRFAVGALKDDGGSFHIQHRPLRNRTLAEIVKIMLDIFIDQVRKFTDFKMDGHDFLDMIFFRMFYDDVKNAFGNSQFVHDLIIETTLQNGNQKDRREKVKTSHVVILLWY